jgi:hypothetical protein
MEISDVVLEGAGEAERETEDDRTLYLLLGGFAFFQAVVAACEHDLFGYVDRNPGVGQDRIGADLGLPHNSTRVLLLACCALRLLTRDRDSGGYSTTPLARRAFIRGKPGDAYPLLRAYHRLHYPALFHTPEAIAKGTNSGVECFPGPGTTLYERLAEQPELERVFHDWMKYLDGMGHTWLHVPELSTAKHVIDAGGGTGPNALMLRQFYPEARVTIFDLPSICAIVDDKLRRWGPAGRGISTAPGNFLEDPLPPGADAVLFVRIFNIYSGETNARLLAKCWEYLPKGGSVIVSNMLAADDETGSLVAAHLSLYFHVLATGQGMVYPLGDYTAWFEAAGFDSLRVYRVGRDRVLVGVK